MSSNHPRAQTAAPSLAEDDDEKYYITEYGGETISAKPLNEAQMRLACETMYGSYEKALSAMEEAHKSVIGAKPGPNDSDVTIIPLPDCPYSVRIWPGGHMATLGGCCFDFMEDGSSVNCPLGYKITSVPLTTDIYPEVGEIKSGERAMGFVHIRPGAETFYVRRDTCYRIDRPGVVSVLFCTPRYSSPARVLSHHALGAIPVGYVPYAFPAPLPFASGNTTFPSPSYDNMPTSIPSTSIQPAALADKVDLMSLHDF